MLILSRGAKITLLGIAVGICATAGVTRLMQSLLFEVSAADPLVLVAVSTLLIVVTLVTCILPSYRAASLDPVRALRTE